MDDDRLVVGLTEYVKLIGPTSSEEHIARIDTGATKSSIDVSLASSLKLGPVVASKLVKNAHGSKLRPVIEANIEIEGKKIKSLFTLADRSHMKYKVLIGQNILKEGFLIDPTLGNVK